MVPSQFEPCGLTQMVSMRYGTVPIVRETGGLKDTVIPYNEYTGKGLGFTFTNYDSEDLKNAVYRALYVYRDQKDAWRKIMLAGMKADHSWTRSAREYEAIYRDIIEME